MMKHYILIIFLLLLGCSKNLLSETAKRDTDSAILFNAKAHLDKSEYAESLADLNRLSTNYQSRREVVTIFASAYAGRCGLRAISLLEHIAQNSNTLFFQVLLQKFSNATAPQIADCMTAEAIMRSLAPGDDFTLLSPDENMFLALISFAKIGAILGTYADLNHNGTADPGFDSCSTAQLPDLQAREVGTGLTIAASALTASGSSVSAGIFSSLNSACTSLPGPLQFCNTLNASAFSTNMVKAINGLIKANEYVGLATCNDTLANCLCP